MSSSAVTPAAVDVKSMPNLRVPKATMPIDASSIGTKRKIICFSDFDGTIFMQDTGHILFNNFGCGSERRQILDQQIHSGERSFRDVSEEMWGSLDVPFDDGFEVMKDALDIDLGFQTFHLFCLNNNIPFNVISAGLKPVLRKVLDHFLGEEASSNIEIVANDATISSDGSEWKPVWLHDTELGHDKAQSINDYREGAKFESDDGTIPMIVFIGDGVSDLPAAREADVLFARRGLRLEEYCIEHKLPYIPFDTFAEIQREVIEIAKVDEEKTKGQGLPANFNPRANLWRRVSSKNAVPLFAALTPRHEKMFVWPEIFTQLKTPLEGQALAVPAA
ncbi:2,3-diketo-5-methylthio-1-phosphopentane phosphatase [Lepidopterella palustris CBS 459.81]|uniref:2,3-diketo-5-methylthio-1-phosphopentane phosphatase n=1 Tax=Lepidopterella palustris CBS 459.81 TaxID=1314670 RepID=A0A8E2JET6_9PEZI|nr:2,3-diketo-5-methylthio-1-phosphopentane phosphatase [Lepidopterella palustris CBS 459.81]